MKQADTSIEDSAHNISVETSGERGRSGLQQLASAVDTVLSGEIVLAVTEKSSVLHETPPFCGFSGHEPVPAETRGMKHHVWIRKGLA